LREGRRAENPPETGAGFRGLSPLQIPTDAGYFYFQAVSWGSVLTLPPRVRRLGGTVSFRGGFCRWPQFRFRRAQWKRKFVAAASLSRYASIAAGPYRGSILTAVWI
jgi:hypothetical protein